VGTRSRLASAVVYLCAVTPQYAVPFTSLYMLRF
jgi:hypothetical protein